MDGQNTKYIVQSGDTLWSVAQRYEVDVEQIKILNNLIDDVIYEGQELVVPKANTGNGKVVYAYYLGKEKISNFEKRLEKVGSNLDILIPCWLELNLNGQIKDDVSKEIIEHTKQQGLKLITLIKNYNFKRQIIDDFLTNKQAKEKTINQLVEILEKYKLDGINIDFEYISSTNRSYLNNFIYDLTTALRDLGALVTMSVPAKVKEDFSSDWSGAFDYQTLGNYVDQMMIMGYDYHWRGGKPGPIAPIYWLENVLEYALSKVPKEKIVLGLPTYGYDWRLNSDNFAQALSYSKVEEKLDKYTTKYQWDEKAKTPYFNYQFVEEEHEVWFEDLDSIKEKLELINKYQIGGVIFWRLGLEDERIWTQIKGKFV